MNIIGKIRIHAPSMVTSNRSEVHSPSALMKAVKRVSNSLQKFTGIFGQKSHSLQPAYKPQIAAIKQETAGTMNNTLKVQSDPASKPHNRRLTPRPTQAPPPPPRASSSSIVSSEVKSKPSKPEPPPSLSLNSNRAVSSVSVAAPLKPVRAAPSIPEKANVSQQQPEISTQNGGEPVKGKITKNDIFQQLKMLSPEGLARVKNGLAVALNERKNNQ
ncbi:TPA: hypothetical protein U5D21_001275 [Yersinia enterocolitica]|nr:hypothetical protein [Yersinia enterocolitica]